MNIELELRQVLPLTLMRAAGGKIKGKTRITKLVFLAEHEAIKQQNLDLSETIDFEFYPYDYGPFSKKLLEDLEYLEREGVIEINESRTFRNKRVDYELRPGAEAGLENVAENREDVEKLQQISEDIYEEYGSLRIRQLLDYVYEEFENWTKNSVYS